MGCSNGKHHYTMFFVFGALSCWFIHYELCTFFRNMRNILLLLLTTLPTLSAICKVKPPYILALLSDFVNSMWVVDMATRTT